MPSKSPKSRPKSDPPVVVGVEPCTEGDASAADEASSPCASAPDVAAVSSDANEVGAFDYLADDPADEAAPDAPSRLGADGLYGDDLFDEAEDDPTEIAAEEQPLDPDADDPEKVEAEAAETVAEHPHLFPFKRAAAKVREFPQTSGVYLMKDAAGRVIYVGKAKRLRSRASSYFLKKAAQEARTAWVHEIADVDFIECDSEVDALLMESRLIKDIQPKHNKELKDDKTFPYLMITTREDFPRVVVTRQPPDKGVRLFGPFASAGALRGAVQVLQRVFQFRTCHLDIAENDERWRHFRPCLLASIAQCTAPCNLRISREDYRRDINRLITFLEGGKTRLLGEMKAEMQAASKALNFEAAARLRDEVKMIEALDRRGEIDTHVQPEVFYVDPRKGLNGLKKVLHLADTPRTIEGIDIAHLGGGQTVASVVQFLDGLPFKPGYRRYKILGVQGIDDFRSIHEVVSRRYRRLSDEDEVFPDILLIDGGKGQLSAALAAFRDQEITPPTLISLAKREEEIYLPGESEPLRLSKHSFALRLLQAVRDEAHRFAQHYHHILRRKSQIGK